MTTAHSRRAFLDQVASVTAALATTGGAVPASAWAHSEEQASAPDPPPWYRRALRWGQTNITEIDPASYDIAWWRRYWRDTRVQGVVLNAGGIVAYYPSKFPLHHRAEALGGRDLYGELAQAAHEDGLYVFARMDSNRTHEAFYRAHPDWFAVDRAGRPYRAGELYVTCINSPYYDEYIPGVLREIIERSHPEGITDNSWSGLDRESPCYCALSATVSRPHRPAHSGSEGLGRSVVPPVDPLELRPSSGGLGSEQSHDAPGGRAALPLGRHEQRKRFGPVEPVP